MKDGDFAGADIVGLTADEIARLFSPPPVSARGN